MKYLCVDSIDNLASFAHNGSLEAGINYWIEDATNGTGAQRRTREALINEYWKSGIHPKYGGDAYSQFRDCLKRDLGEGFDKYIYVEIIMIPCGGEFGSNEARAEGIIKEANSFEEIPEYIRNDKRMTSVIRGRLKSCGKYTKKQNMNFIDKLIEDMIANGVNSKRFQELMEGLQ